jgi:hypothetical protein
MYEKAYRISRMGGTRPYSRGDAPDNAWRYLYRREHVSAFVNGSNGLGGPFSFSNSGLRCAQYPVY